MLLAIKVETNLRRYESIRSHILCCNKFVGLLHPAVKINNLFRAIDCLSRRLSFPGVINSRTINFRIINLH